MNWNRNGWVAITGTAALTVVTVVGIYAYHFGPATHWRLSDNPEDWARFGEYVGGMFAMLAFVGVVITINLQRKQLLDQQAQFALEEMQRLAGGLARNVDAILETEPSGVNDALRARMRVQGARLSVFVMLSAVGTNALRPKSSDYMIVARNDDIRAKSVPLMTQDINLAMIQLQHLVQCLQRYEAAGGSRQVIDTYVARYKMIVAWIYAIDLSTSTITTDYFDSARYVDTLRQIEARRLAGDQAVSDSVN